MYFVCCEYCPSLRSKVDDPTCAMLVRMGRPGHSFLVVMKRARTASKKEN